MAQFLGAGFTGSAISLIETGRLKPSSRQASRLVEVFGVPIGVLLDERPSFESLKNILESGDADADLSKLEATS